MTFIPGDRVRYDPALGGREIASEGFKPSEGSWVVKTLWETTEGPYAMLQRPDSPEVCHAPVSELERVL